MIHDSVGMAGILFVEPPVVEITSCNVNKYPMANAELGGKRPELIAVLSQIWRKVRESGTWCNEGPASCANWFPDSFGIGSIHVDSKSQDRDGRDKYAYGYSPPSGGAEQQRFDQLNCVRVDPR